MIIFGAVTVSFEMIATVWWEIFSTKYLYIQLESISLMNCKFKNLSWPGPFSKSFFSVELNYSTKKFSPRWLFLRINPLFLDQCCKAPKCSGFEDNNIFNQKDVRQNIHWIWICILKQNQTNVTIHLTNYIV